MKKEPYAIFSIPTIEYRKRALRKAVNDACHLLKINNPNITFVECLFQNELGTGITTLKSAKQTLHPADLIGGYADEKYDLVIIPLYAPVCNVKTLTSEIKKVSTADSLYAILHELRHVCQKEFDFDKYYAHNAFGFSEIINDPAEIDADAFAIAFMLSQYTKYSFKDFPFSLNELHLQGSLDGGQRWNRAIELAKEYKFDNLEQLEEAKNAISPLTLKQIKAYQIFGGFRRA